MRKKQESKFYNDTLNNNIRKLLEENNISNKEFAERLDVSKEAVRLWNSGYSRPDMSKIVDIADIFSVTTDYLLREGESKSLDYTEQMTAKKFGLSDEAMKQLNLITNNKSSDNNVLKLQLINYIIENNNFLIELTENMLEFYKANDYKLSTDKKKQKEIKIFKYELQDVFAKFIDNSYKDLWENKGIKQTFLFEMTKERKNKKKKEGK